MSIDIKQYLANAQIFHASTDDQEIDTKIQALMHASEACGKWISDREGSCQTAFDARNLALKELVDLVRERLGRGMDIAPSL
jgi:hypothetical protein